jgi:hypothetical protein
MAHTDLTPPDPQPILDLVEGFRRSKVLFAAVELGVFDQLAQGPASAAALAADLRCDADALERLLTRRPLRSLEPFPGSAGVSAGQPEIGRTPPRPCRYPHSPVM